MLIKVILSFFAPAQRRIFKIPVYSTYLHKCIFEIGQAADAEMTKTDNQQDPQL